MQSRVRHSLAGVNRGPRRRKELISDIWGRGPFCARLRARSSVARLSAWACGMAYGFMDGACGFVSRRFGVSRGSRSSFWGLRLADPLRNEVVFLGLAQGK